MNGNSSQPAALKGAKFYKCPNAGVKEEEVLYQLHSDADDALIVHQSSKKFTLRRLQTLDSYPPYLKMLIKKIHLPTFVSGFHDSAVNLQMRCSIAIKNVRRKME